ncbi:anti-sigma factor family protein [uncultured Amnibacterium sp.]|uniref:anti-sigma factor family protein n=1 Tax=uncultured Amnibacterium sp. TaxID=1631851 RepID=UPI0035CCA589
MSDPIHEWDGAYVLGALSPDDRRRFEAHLADCSACSRSVRELAGLPGILGRLDRDEALALRDLPDDNALRNEAHAPGRAAGVARRVRRRRLSRLLAAAALALVLVGGSAAGWSIARSLQPGDGTAVAEHRLTAVGASHLSADLTVTPVGWGTRIDWSCDYRAPGGSSAGGYAPTSYSLVVTTDAGTTSTVATWTSDAGEAKGLVAATAIPVDTIASIDIRVTGTRTPLAETTF